MSATERVNDAVDEAVAAHRAQNGCWCAAYRKPCEYHAGVEYGAELALHVLGETEPADVDDWRAGA